MTTFEVAHVREQGQDMIIVPMKPEFGRRPAADQANTEAALTTAAHAAGLAGRIVTVWDAGGGRMAFRAPHPWHPFFSRIGLGWVSANVNKRITVG